MDVDDVIQTAAQLVDSGIEVDDEYRRGVVALATELCFPTLVRSSDAMTVMGYAVCGVNRAAQKGQR